MKIRGPILTLVAVAVLGVGILLVNMSKEQSAPPANPYGKSTTTAAAATPATPPPAPSTPPPPAFPAKADYVGKIPTANATITVEITVQGDKAIAYACDGSKVESWLRGSAMDGTASLASKDKTSRLDGRLEGNAIDGTLSFAFAPLGGNPAVQTVSNGPLTSDAKQVYFDTEGPNLIGYYNASGDSSDYDPATDTKVFTMTLASTGVYAFTLHVPVDQPIGGGDIIAINLNGRVTVSG